MNKLTVKYEVFRVNPFIPLPCKGKPPQFALMPASFYRDMSKHFKNKKHQPLLENGGYIKALIMNGDSVIGIGTATCSMSDKFDAKTGMKLALNRAFDATGQRVKEIAGSLQSGLADLMFKEGE